ncbi:hypothetical protein LV89_02024 [Arcicella aurantiaca]|uniref:Uncharacterized protein n=1 Tax=Arcicella aurantiaca TaxID=591202 RepID=A0A316EEU8_9BACT|nr:hypothetical protein [Arcicella aurantiaca]PWK27209.1 hypothetical protein LV89_02024 [Arcicella aurantiaca]
MRYYKLDPNVLRTYLAAKVWYAVNDDNTAYTASVLGENTKEPWGVNEEYDEPLDLSDCTEITKSAYMQIYEKVIDLNTV